MIRVATEADSQLVQELWRAFNDEVKDAPWRDDDSDEFAPEVCLLADDDGVIALTKRGTRVWFVDVLYVRPDDSGFMSATGRGGDRILYSLSGDDVRFYLEAHGLLAQRAVLEMTA